MPQQTTISVRVDENIKRDIEVLLDNLGMNMSVAINMLFKQMLVDKGLPFIPNYKNKESEEFHNLIYNIRTENEKKGFLSDEEINAEINAYRQENHGINP